MAGNVSAFSTVWTYDIYKPLINKKGSDSHYVMVGRMSIVIGVAISIGAAYLVMHAHGIMDYVQALFSFFIAPLLGAILLGMFWKRATAPAGFLGLLGRHLHFGQHVRLGQVQSRGLATIALSPDAKPMAENLYRGLWAFLITVIVISLSAWSPSPSRSRSWKAWCMARPSCPQEEPVPFYKNECIWAVLVVVIFAALNILFGSKRVSLRVDHVSGSTTREER